MSPPPIYSYDPGLLVNKCEAFGKPPFYGRRGKIVEEAITEFVLSLPLYEPGKSLD